MTVNEAIIKRVEFLLKENGMSKYRLEQNSGMDHGHLRWVMSGKSKTVTLSTVAKLAKGFNMTIAEFLGDELFDLDNLEIE